MLRLTPIVANADNIVNCCLLASCPSQDHLSTLGKFFHSRQNMRHFQHRFSVDVSMRKTEGVSKLANIKKDARLTIRIPRELKAKIEGSIESMASRCPRSQMNASGRFARTSNKRNRHQLSRSALLHIHPTTGRQTTLQFAGAEDVKTVSGKEYKNTTVRLAAPSPLSIAFSTKQAVCSCEHCQAKLCLRLLT